MGALLNIVLICCVSSLLILSFTGTAGAGLYLAGSKDKTESLEQEMVDAYMKQLDDELEEELEVYDDPRSYSFKTRKESTKGFGALPYFPTGAFYRRRPIESALTWEFRGNVLPNSGPNSYTIKSSAGKYYTDDNISESPTSIKWLDRRDNVWTNRFDADSLKIDCGNDALNSFQLKSEKKSVTRDIIKPKTDEVTGTTLSYRHQFKSYHDNYKQLYKCLTGSEGWGWDSDERVIASGETDYSVSTEQTLEREGVKPDGNQNRIMDCDYEAIGASEFGEEGAAREFPISMIEPVWDNAIVGKDFYTITDTTGPMTTDYYLDPKLMNFKYKCLKKRVFGPCKDMKYTEWTPFLASQGEGPRELRHLMKHGTFDPTSKENIETVPRLKELLNPTVDPVKGLGRVKCHPTEVLTRLDFEVSEGLDAPKDYVRWGYRCCKM